MIYLDDHLYEFSNELGTFNKEKIEHSLQIKKIIKERYPNIKVKMVKVIIGGIAVTSLPLMNLNNQTVEASSGPVTSQVLQSDSVYYQVEPGDTLWKLATRFNSSIDHIQRANQLTSVTLQINQKLIIPKVFHTVKSGDYLSILAKQHNVTVEAIKETNGLTSDLIRIGQTLIIPVLVSGSSTSNTQQTNYTVVSGDSLFKIAQQFGTTINALKNTNNLSSDVLQIGQTLTIPGHNRQNEQENKTTNYTVQAGDTLSAIAKRFNVSVRSIQSANQLSSDLIRVGQNLSVPNGETPPTESETNRTTYATHTVASGDNIWDLSIQYGIPQTELLRTNNLTTSSRLSIGQKLSIPVHHIPVKSVVSESHGEYLDWWTEAQYIFTIGKTAHVTDLDTGKSFNITRTIGANHADSETNTVADTNTAKSIWGGFSWTPRAVILEVDGRRISASMSFMPHDIDYISSNGISGHFDVYFGNSTRHVDGKADASHQAQVERAAGLR